MKIKQTLYYNNGYGGSYCRNDWTNVSIIDDSLMISFSELLKEEQLNELYDNANGLGGLVGIEYSLNNNIIYSVTTNIYNQCCDMYVTFGMIDENDFINKFEIGIGDYCDTEIQFWSIDKIINNYNESACKDLSKY